MGEAEGDDAAFISFATVNMRRFLSKGFDTKAGPVAYYHAAVPVVLGVKEKRLGELIGKMREVFRRVVRDVVVAEKGDVKLRPLVSSLRVESENGGR